jgi:tetratricopeptide (TPR) repeat protein
MSMTQTQALIEAVNAALDPVTLLNDINFLPEKKVLTGTTLRAPCPIHRDPEFQTLFINTRKKNFRCSVSTCPGNKPGNLVELYALSLEISPAAAARRLVKKLSLDIDLSDFEHLADECFDQAEEHFVRCEWHEARQMARRTLELDADHSAARLIIARAYQAEGKEKQAVRYYSKVLEHHIANRDFQAGCELMDRLLADRVFDNQLLELLIKIADETKTKPQFFQQLKSLLQATPEGDFKAQIDLLLILQKIKPDDTETLESLASVYKQKGADEQAVNLYLELAQQPGIATDNSQQLRYLNEALSINPEYLKALELKADLLFRSKDKVQAVETLLQLVDLARQREDFDAVGASLDKVLELDPLEARALEPLAEHHVEQGDQAKAARCYLKAAMGALEKNDKDAALEWATKAKGFLGDDIDLYEEYVQVLDEVDSADELLSAKVQHARLLHQSGQNDSSLLVLRELLLEFKSEPDKRQLVIEHLQELGFHNVARQESENLLQACFTKGDNERVVELADETLGFLGEASDPTGCLRIKIEALRRLDRDTERDDCIIQTAEYLENNHSLRRVERFLIDAITTDKSARIVEYLIDVELRHDSLLNAELNLAANLNWLMEADRESGIRMLESVTRKGSERIDFIERLGREYLEFGKAEQGLEYLNQVLQHYQKEGELEPQAALLEDMVETATEKPELSASLILVLCRLHRLQEARARILKLLETQVNLTDQHIEKLLQGVLIAHENNADFLRELFEKAKLRQDQNQDVVKWAVIEQSRLMAGRGQFAEAIDLLKETLEMYPGAIKLLGRLALYYYRNDEDEASLNEFRQLTQREYSDEEHKAQVAFIKDSLECFPDEIPFLEYALEHLKAADYGINNLATLAQRVAEHYQIQGDAEKECRYLKLHAQYTENVSTNMRLRLAELGDTLGDSSLQSEQLLEIARNAMDSGENARAEQMLESIVEQFPENEEARSFLVTIYRVEDRKEELLRELSTLSELMVKKEEYSRAELYLSDAMMLFPANTDIQEKLALVHEKQGNIRASIPLYLGIARAYYDEKNNDKALQVLEHLAEIAPDDTRYLALLSKLRELSGNIPGAITARLLLAHKAVSENDPAKLAKISERIDRLEEANGEAYEQLGDNFLSLKLDENAARHYRKSAEQYLDEENLPGARKTCTKSLELNPNDIIARELLLTLQRKDDNPEAKSESLRQLATSYASSGNWDEAINAYNELIEGSAQTDPAIYQDLAECYLLAGDEKKAHAILKHLCLQLNSMDDSELVISLSRRLIDNDEGDMNLRLRLADAYRNSEKPMPELDQRSQIFDLMLDDKKLDEATEQLERMKELKPQALETLLAEAVLASHQDEDSASDKWREFTKSCCAAGNPTLLAQSVKHVTRLHKKNLALRGFVVYHLLGMTDQLDHIPLVKALTNDAKKLQDDSDLIAAMNQAIESFPNVHQLYAERARLHSKMDDSKKGRADFCKALEILKKSTDIKRLQTLVLEAMTAFPDDPELIGYAAWLAEHQGDVASQVEHLQKQVAIFKKKKAPAEDQIVPLERLHKLLPDDTTIENALVRQYRSSGQARKAADLFKKKAEGAAAESDHKQAAKLYSQAIKIDPSYIGLRREYAEQLVQNERMREARDELLEVADVQLSEDNHPAAIVTLQRVNEIAPGHPEAYIKLSSLYRRQNNHEEAAKYTERAVNLLIDDGQIERAVDLLEDYPETSVVQLTSRKNLFSVLFSLDRATDAEGQGLRLAHHYLKAEEFTQARLIIDKLLCLENRNSRLYEQVVDLLLEFNLLKEALDAAQKGISNMLGAGKTDEALDLVKHIESIDLQPSDIVAVQLELARHLNFEDDSNREIAGKIIETLAEIDDPANDSEELKLRQLILESNADHPVMVKRTAELMSRSGDKKAAEELLLKTFEEHKAADPNEAFPLLQLALEINPQSLAASEAVVNHYEQTGQEAALHEALVGLAEIHEQQGDSAKQEVLLKKVLEADPHNISALRIMMEMARRRQDAQRIWDLGFKLGTVYESMGQADEARRLYEEAVMMDGNNLEAWQKLAQLAEHTDDVDQTVRIYKNLARAHENRGNLEAAIEAFEKVIAFPQTNLEAAKEGAELAVANEDIPMAVKFFEKTLDDLDKTGSYRISEAEEICRKILRLAPDQHSLRKRLALMLEKSGDKDAALLEWRQLLSIFEVRNKRDETLLACQKIIALSDDIDQHLVILHTLFKNNLNEEAIELVRGYLEAEPNTLDDEKRAELLKIWAEQVADDDELHLKASQAHEKIGNMELATHHLALAATLNSQNGNTDKATELLTKAKSMAPDLPTVKMLEAFIAGATGDQSAGLQELWNLVEEAKKDNQPLLLLDLYRSIMSLSPKDREVRLAYLDTLAQLGRETEAGHERMQLAREALQAQDEELALQLVASLTDSTDLHADELSDLAELYEANLLEKEARVLRLEAAHRLIEAKEHDAARELIQRVLKEVPDHIGALKLLVRISSNSDTLDTKNTQAHLARVLIENDHLEEADVLLKNLHEQHPEAADYLDFMATIALKRGNTRQALELWDQAAETFREQEKNKREYSILGKLLEHREDSLPLYRRRIELAVTFADSAVFEKETIDLGKLLVEKKDLAELQKLIEETEQVPIGNIAVVILRIFLARVRNETDNLATFSLQAGRLLKEACRYDEAITYLREGLQECSDNLQLHLLLADIYGASDKEGMRRQELDICIQLAGSETSEDNIEIARQLHELEPQNLGHLEKLVDLLYQFNDINLLPKYSSELAKLYQERQHADQAVQVYRRLLDLIPTSRKAIDGYFDLLRESYNDEELAIEQYRLVKQITSVGVEEKYREESRSAVRYLLEQAILLAPESASILESYFEEFREELDAPTREYYLIRLTSLHFSEGSISRAHHYLTQAEDMLGGDHPDVVRYSQLLSGRSAFEPTPENKLSQEIQIDNMEPSEKMRQEAIANFHEILSIDPDCLEAHQGLAVLFRQMNQKDEELKHQEEVIRLLELQGSWDELLAVLSMMVERFPGQGQISQKLQKVRRTVRSMNIIEGDETKTMVDG